MVRFSAGVCSIAAIAFTLFTTVSAVTYPAAETFDCTAATTRDNTVVDQAGNWYILRCTNGRPGGTDMPAGPTTNAPGTLTQCFDRCRSLTSATPSCSGFQRGANGYCYLKQGASNATMQAAGPAMDAAAIGAVIIQRPADADNPAPAPAPYAGPTTTTVSLSGC